MTDNSLSAPSAHVSLVGVEHPSRRPTLARWRHRLRRRWRQARLLSAIVFRELLRTRALDVAAGVAFWLMMSMVPLLMTVVALLSILHLPGFVPQLLGILAMLVPPGGLSLVEKLVGSLLTPHRAILSFGVISYLWSSTGGFVSLIAALNIAYDVTTARSWMRDRIQAVIMTFTSGGLLLASMLAIVAGPHLLVYASQIVPIPPFVQHLWTFIRYGTVFVCFVLGLEIIYFLGPNMRQRFTSTLPGAVLATFIWFLGSSALAFYLDHFSNYSRMYGGMGAILGLMFWIYLTSLAILIGAEANAELAKRRDTLFRSHLRSASGRRSLKKENASRSSAPGRTAA